MVLLVIAFLTGVFESNPSTVEVPALDVPGEDITSIRLLGPSVEIALERQADGWRVTQPVDAEADSAAVARLLETVGSLELQSVVSTSADRHGRYGVDSTAMTLELSWEGGETSLILGERARGARYVRVDGGEAVYRTAGRLDVPESADEWRDKTMVDLNPSDVSRVSIVGPDRSVVLSRNGGTWKLLDQGEPVPADSAAVQRYLDRFDPLRADGFAASSDTAASYTVTVELATGTEHVIEFAQTDDGLAATVSGGSAIYQLRPFRLNQLAPGAGEFSKD